MTITFQWSVPATIQARSLGRFELGVCRVTVLVDQVLLVRDYARQGDNSRKEETTVRSALVILVRDTHLEG